MTTESTDFAILKNCHINSDAICDAAAERMARSKDACDREIGRLRIEARTRSRVNPFSGDPNERTPRRYPDRISIAWCR